jgi:hypothetical protein
MNQAAGSMISWTMNFKNNDSGAKKMKSTQVKYTPFLKNRQGSLAIQTTLYELMETVIDVADPMDGKLVNDVTINILAKAKPSIRVGAH